MFMMASTAPKPGLVVDLPYRWRRETYAEITDWKTLTRPAGAQWETAH